MSAVSLSVASAGRSRDAGLTLFEMLIVLSIIGVTTSAAVLGTSALNRDTRLEDEASRLAVLLQVAADEALVNGQPLVLEWSEKGYGFRRWLGAGWGAAADGRLATLRPMPAGVMLQRADGTPDPVTIGTDGLGAAVTLRLAAAGVVWDVAFDGVKANAALVQALP